MDNTHSWRESIITGSHLKVKELIAANPRVKAAIKAIDNAMLSGSRDKWSISNGVEGDLKGAESGLQSKPGGRPTSKDLIKNGNKRGWIETKGKQQFRDELIKHKGDLVVAIKKISENIMISRMDDDYFMALCVDYVKERYSDDRGERKRIRKIVESEENERKFVRLWKVVLKRELSPDEINKKFDEEIRDLE